MSRLSVAGDTDDLELLVLEKVLGYTSALLASDSENNDTLCHDGR